MVKDDEKELLAEVQRLTAQKDCFISLRALSAELGMHPNRAAYICFKWTDKGWYDYGVNVLSGWLTEEGKAISL